METDRNAPMPDREKMKADASEMMNKVQSAGKQKLESGKTTAGEGAEKIAGVFDEASKQLKEHDLQSLAEYANQIGGSIKSFSDQLRSRSVDDLLNDAQTMARRNPTMFLLGSMAIGFAITRFLKASAERKHSSYESGSYRNPENYAGETGFPRDPRVGRSVSQDPPEY
jgi:hypothetical protein